MNIKDLLDKLNWLVKLILGEYAKILAAYLAWQGGFPVDVQIIVNQVKLRITAQQGGAPGVKRRLVIEELV